MHRSLLLVKTVMAESVYYEDVQDGYPTLSQEPIEFAASNATIAGGIDADGHLQAQDLHGVMTRVFDIHTPPGATLETLAKDNKEGIFWEMPTELKNALRHVNKMQGRATASDKDRFGSLNKGLILKAQVISYHNNSPKRLGLEIPGLVPTYFTNTGRFNFVIPARCNNTVVKQDISEADNVFTRWMYETNQKCNMRILNNNIRLDVDPHKQDALIATKSLPWKSLCDNLNIPQGPFEAYAEEIFAKNPHIFNNPDSQHIQYATVPYVVAERLREAIAEPLQRIEAAYTNFDTFKVKIVPADGKPWNDSTGLVGESAVFGAHATGFEEDAHLNTPIDAGCQLELKLCFDE